MQQNSEKYNHEIKVLARSIRDSLSCGTHDGLPTCFENYFLKLNAYLKDDSVTNKDIYESAGQSDGIESVIMFASTYAGIVGDSGNAFSALFNLAQSYFDRAYYKAAHAIFTIAKSIALEEQIVECALSMALLYEEIGEISKAILVLEDSISDAPRLPDAKKAHNSKLNTLLVRIALDNFLSEDDKERKKDSDCVIELEKHVLRATLATNEDEGNYEAHYVRGLAYKKQALYSSDTEVAHNFLAKAIISIETAIKQCVCDTDGGRLFRGSCFIELGKICDSKGDYTSALTNLENAKAIFGKKGLGYPVYEMVTDDLIRQAQAKADSFDNDQGFSEEIHQIMTDKSMTALERKYYENKAIRKNFIRESHRINNSTEPSIYTLQRWNSYTPILSTATAPSKGGGYFISTGNMGIVFDPGFDFIQNFRSVGMNFNDIDHIFITHAHNDHTADLESLLSLLHDYNEAIKGHRFSEKQNCIFRKIMNKYPKYEEEFILNKVEEAFRHSPRRKRIHIYVSPGTKEKCGFLKLGSNEYELTILNTSQVNYDDTNSNSLFGGIKLSYYPYNDSKHITVYPIPAKHDDLMTNRDCFGYVTVFAPEKVTLWYTGDTGFSEEIGKHFSTIRNMLAPHLGFEYPNMDDYKGMILLAHIGGFKPDEQYYYRTNASKAFYKGHLGRLGICKMIECIKPSLCLISEFGEEFSDCREGLIEIFQRYYPNSVILPADIDCQLRLKSNPTSITDFLMNVENEGFVDIRHVAFNEEPDSKTSEWKIKYSKKKYPPLT